MNRFGKVLVTGGAGFLGSQLVKRLIPICDRIVVLDNLTTGRRDAVPKAEHIDFYEASVTSESVLERLLPGTDTVFHMACANLVMSAQDMDHDFYTNLFGGYLLLKKTSQLCPSLRKFIYASTASVYGNADIIPTPEHQYRISLPYSASKFSVEHYAQVFHQMKGLPVVTLRFSNVYGPGQVTSNPYCGVVSKFFEALSKRRPFTIYGDGKQTRDFTYVEDAMDALLSAAVSPDSDGKVYNVGTGKQTSVIELADMVARTAGYPTYPRIFESSRDIDRVERRAVDIGLIRRDLEWEPRYTLEEGLRNTYIWFKEEEAIR